MALVKSSVFNLSLAVAVQLTTIVGFCALIQTPPAILAQGIPERWQIQEFKVPDDIGVPGRRQQAGTRSGGCMTQKRLTALVPVESYGVTVSGYPQFLFYMPKMAAGSATPRVEFVLKDSGNNNSDIYRANFSTSGQSGIISVNLPPEAGLPPLQVGKVYYWSFSIVCDPESPETNIFVDGRIKRIEPNTKLSSQLPQAQIKDKARLYAQAEIWFDALTTLAQVRRNYPNDLAAAAEWEKLLNSVGLGDLTQESLVLNQSMHTGKLTTSQRYK